MNPILLSEALIRHHLTTHAFHAPINLHVLSSVDSTNRFLKDLPVNDHLDICCAETQTHGRGRFGRSWYSPLCENIYCSSRWYFNGDLNQLTGLGLVVSLAIIATLTEFGLHENIRIKWPNDVLWQDKKLSGNLIEIVPHNPSSLAAIIGIGLNVNAAQSTVQTHAMHSPPTRPWCSLNDISPQNFDRNTIIARLMIKLHQHIQAFVHDGLSVFIPQWQQVDYLYGKTITTQQASGPLTGMAKGINDLGQLILMETSGVMHYLSSGETSLGSVNIYGP